MSIDCPATADICNHHPFLHVRISSSLKGKPEAIVRIVTAFGLEGVVAKLRDSRYEAGERSGAWVKLPLKPKDEFIIGAYLRPETKRKCCSLAGR